MMTLHIELPDDLRSIVSLDEEQLTGLAREALLVRLYERGEISSGKAAELLNVSRREFLDRLADYGVSSFDDSADLSVEMKHGRRA